MNSSEKNAPVALVTGAGKPRIGWHVADALADAGYQIAIHYRTSAAEAQDAVEYLRNKGATAEAFAANLANEEEVRQLVREVKTRFGRIDLLVTCAAIWNKKTLEETTAADVLEHFEANALSTFLCCQQVGLEMVKQLDGGCIVTLGDWADVRPYLHYSAYFASKGAVHAMTRAMAVELGSRNSKVRVNCIQPGPVLLPPDLTEAERRVAVEGTLAKREGDPRPIAAAVLYFAQNEFVTGVSLPIDGGRTIFSPDSAK